MTQAYANQILALALGMSALGLGGLFIASRLYDRKTRQLEARGGGLDRVRTKA